MTRFAVPRRAMLWSAIVALLAAAVLVVYLQHRSDERQRQQTDQILQQVCERTAGAVAGQMRQLLDAAVIETIEGIGHPQVKEFDLPRVASFFRTGTGRHFYVDRFFIWSEHNPPDLRHEVLFYRPYLEPGARRLSIAGPGGEPLGDLFSQPELGREILGLALGFATSRRSFVVVDHVVGGVAYETVVHFLWEDPRRESFFAIIGYSVNLAQVEKQLFAELAKTELAKTLNPDATYPQLSLTVRNERKQVIYGDDVASGAAAFSADVDVLFFPGEVLKQWLAARPQGRRWQFTVSAPRPAATLTPADWVSLGVVVLIVVALVCAVIVDVQAIRLSRMQAAFVANVSHELKTPLSLLIGASDTLGLGRVRSPEKLDEYVAIVRTQAARLTKLVDRILSFSKSEGGAAASRRQETVDLGRLVAESVASFQGAAPPGVTFRCQVPREIRLANADRSGLEEVLLNLLENAANYGNGHNDVLVRAEATGRDAVICVRDHGLGIERTELPHIFDKFYRGSNGGRRQRPGFGLGLSIVWSVVRAHGGRVEVESEPGSGSEFRVILPLSGKAGDHGNASADR